MNNMNWAGAVVNTEIYERLLLERPEESHKNKLRSSEMSSSRHRLMSGTLKHGARGHGTEFPLEPQSWLPSMRRHNLPLYYR